ncbi:hypothetical protein B857_03951 [Solibacillus isronensis B3W22]|uniref:Uncharacterized protein n=1 Tax=Solibacillus isronensis B3W22 TaxID=1224748 RepID=K1KGT0_9BACL|nr:hypothetical protein B857_03951 [Solibacillus isronensis B3W22]
MDQLADRLLQRVLDVIHVVGDSREQIPALAGVEVVQRQPVELGFHVAAQPVDDLHHQPVQHPALHPHEQRGDEVHGQHDQDVAAQQLEVDADPRDQVHLREHLGQVVLPGVAQLRDDLIHRHVGRHVPADGPGEDHVHGLAQDLGGDDGQHDACRDEEQDDGHAEFFGGEQAHQALGRGPEVFGLAHGCRIAEHVGGAGGIELVDFLDPVGIVHDCRG